MCVCVHFHRKANIEAQNNDSYTPLLTAVAQGKKQSMEVLMDKGAAVEVFDREGKSIVYLAAQYNHVNILKVHYELTCF